MAREGVNSALDAVVTGVRRRPGTTRHVREGRAPMGFVLRLIVNAIALLIVEYLIPGVHVAGIEGALIAALILGVVNAVLKPVLIILSLPLEILTLGLFTFVINAALFYLVAKLGIGLSVDGFWSAFLGSLVLSVVSFILSALTPAARR